MVATVESCCQHQSIYPTDAHSAESQMVPASLKGGGGGADPMVYYGLFWTDTLELLGTNGEIPKGVANGEYG